MATPAEELINAVNADDAVRVAELVAEDPSLASARDLDVFEATALGYIDRLRERLMADPTSAAAFSPDGFTALHYAGFFGKVEAARELISAGASVDVYTQNPFANQPLHAAAAGRHHEVCRVLLGAGADVNATQHGGYTPLHEAAQSGDVELAELFLSAGADPSVVSDAGETPAETAETAGHRDLAARIREVAEAR
jgi:ankyrin repeat protein